MITTVKLKFITSHSQTEYIPELTWLMAVKQEQFCVMMENLQTGLPPEGLSWSNKLFVDNCTYSWQGYWATRKII